MYRDTKTFSYFLQGADPTIPAPVGWQQKNSTPYHTICRFSAVNLCLLQQLYVVVCSQMGISLLLHLSCLEICYSTPGTHLTLVSFSYLTSERTGDTGLCCYRALMLLATYLIDKAVQVLMRFPGTCECFFYVYQHYAVALQALVNIMYE